jgi:hypothetical protein
MGVTSVTVAEALDRDHESVARTMSYLADAGYFKASSQINQATAELMMEVEQLLERTLQELAGWPISGLGSDFYDHLVVSIDERITTASSDERSRLQRLRGAVVDLGRDIVIEIASKTATGG